MNINILNLTGVERGGDAELRERFVDSCELMGRSAAALSPTEELETSRA